MLSVGVDLERVRVSELERGAEAVFHGGSLSPVLRASVEVRESLGGDGVEHGAGFGSAAVIDDDDVAEVLPRALDDVAHGGGVVVRGDEHAGLELAHGEASPKWRVPAEATPPPSSMTKVTAAREGVCSRRSERSSPGLMGL